MNLQLYRFDWGTKYKYVFPTNVKLIKSCAFHMETWAVKPFQAVFFCKLFISNLYASEATCNITDDVHVQTLYSGVNKITLKNKNQFPPKTTHPHPGIHTW